MRRDRLWLVALLLYTVLSVAYAWPLLLHFTDGLAGDGFDMYVFQWGNWWIPRALCSGQSPYHTHMIFYPVGANLFFHSFSWLNTAIWWILKEVVGNIAAYNFTVWWSWPLSGLGAFLLAAEILDDRRAALIAGLVYAFFPYHFAQRNHLNLLSVQWIPFSVLYLMRAVQGRRVRDGVLAGLFLALCGLSGWHLLTLTVMLGALWVLYAWLTERHRWAGGSWRAVLALVSTLFVLTGPLLLPIVWDWFINPYGQDPYLGKEQETQTDLVAYFLPNLYHPVWGEVAAPVHSRFLRNKDHAVALGYVPLLLLISQLNRRGMQGKWFWLIGLLGFLVLALGPFPRVNGVPYPHIPLPYRLVGWVPLVSSLRTPERFNIIVALCLAMAVGSAIEKLTECLPQRFRSGVYVVVGLLILVEYWAWPFPTTSPDIPRFYYQLADEPGECAILDLPMSNDLSKLYMFYQTVHQKPVVVGHVSRPPAESYTFIEQNQFLRTMWHRGRPDPSTQPTIELAQLADAGICYIVIHTDHMDPGQIQELLAYLDQASVYHRFYVGEKLIVYKAGEVALPTRSFRTAAALLWGNPVPDLFAP